MTDISIISQNVAVFLGRVDLKGTEVAAFTEVSNWIAQKIAEEQQKLGQEAYKGSASGGADSSA
jgi:hypothetical protein